MLYISNIKQLNQDRARFIFPPRKDSVTYAQSIALIFFSITAYQSNIISCSCSTGTLFFPLMTITFGLVSLLSSYLFIETAVYHRSSTTHEIWEHLWGSVSIFIPRIADYLLLILWAFWDYNTLIISITEATKYFFGSTSRFLNDSFLIGMVAYFIICIPLIAVKSVRTLSWLYAIAILFTILVLLSSLFLPKTDVKSELINKKYIDGKTMYRFLVQFLVQPLAYPGLRQLSRTTKGQAFNLFAISILLGIFFYIILEELLVRIFPPEILYNDEISFISYIQTPIVYIMTIYRECIILISGLNPLRYFVINSLFPSDDVPYVLWIWAGLIISSSGTFIAKISEYLTNVFYYLEAILVITTNYIFPAILYLGTFKFSNMWGSIGAIFLIVFAAIFGSLIIYLE